jgi:hypothetical protein
MRWDLRCAAETWTPDNEFLGSALRYDAALRAV